jgi:BppU N-terminal domain
MYGFSSYAANSYAIERFLGGFLGPVIQTAPFILRFLGRALIQPLGVFQGDYGYQISFVLLDGNGNAVDLSGANLSLKVQSSQDLSDTLLTLGGAVTIDNATEGTCHYTVASGAFANPGALLAQLSAAYGTETITWGGFQIIVLPALPKAIN